jgi:ADP-ribose pyrophosphatase
MDYVEKTVKTNYVYKGKILSVRADDAMLPDGTPCKREIVDHSGGACALYVDNGEILFVRQYRYAYGESVLELPAGKCEQGEDPLLTAKRELAEETGVQAKQMRLIQKIYPSPGYTNEIIYIYHATEGETGKNALDEGEFLDVVRIPVEQAKQMLTEGAFTDAKTVVALQAYFLCNKNL